MKTKPTSHTSPNKPRKCASVLQVRELERTFECDPRPSHDKRIQLANRLDMHPRTVQIWFQNRRAKARSQNHLMVKTVNCSAPLTNMEASTTINTGQVNQNNNHNPLPLGYATQSLPISTAPFPFPYSTKQRSNTLPQFSDIMLPYCMSPKPAEYMMNASYNNPHMTYDDRFSVQSLDFNSPNNFLTSPSINATSPCPNLTPYNLAGYHPVQYSAEMVDEWGTPYNTFQNQLYY